MCAVFFDSRRATLTVCLLRVFACVCVIILTHVRHDCFINDSSLCSTLTHTHTLTDSGLANPGIAFGGCLRRMAASGKVVHSAKGHFRAHIPIRLQSLNAKMGDAFNGSLAAPNIFISATSSRPFSLFKQALGPNTYIQILGLFVARSPPSRRNYEVALAKRRRVNLLCERSVIQCAHNTHR